MAFQNVHVCSFYNMHMHVRLFFVGYSSGASLLRQATVHLTCLHHHRPASYPAIHRSKKSTLPGCPAMYITNQTTGIDSQSPESLLSVLPRLSVRTSQECAVSAVIAVLLRSRHLWHHSAVRIAIETVFVPSCDICIILILSFFLLEAFFL